MSLVFKVKAVIDGTGSAPLSPGMVTVEGGRITAVGSTVNIPADAEIIDAPSSILMPGMIDCHVHVRAQFRDLTPNFMTTKTVHLLLAVKTLEKMLRAGFTTVRDAGGADVGLSRAVEAGLIEGPRLITAGAIGPTGTHLSFQTPVGAPVSPATFGAEDTIICDGPDEVRKATRQVCLRGFDFVKLCGTGGLATGHDQPDSTEFTEEELRVAVETAASQGRRVMCHAEGNLGIKNALRAGIWSLEHGSELDDEAIELMLARGIYLVPTVFIFARFLGEPYLRFFDVPDPLGGLPEHAIRQGAAFAERHVASLQKALEAGVKIGMGSDSLHRMLGRNAIEICAMVTAGMSPMQVMVAATKTAAEICRVGDTVGTIEVGKLADLLLVEGDPLQDVTVLLDTNKLSVFKGGKRVGRAS